MIVLESAAVCVCVTGTEPTVHGSAQVPVAAPVAVSAVSSTSTRRHSRLGRTVGVISTTVVTDVRGKFVY